jgi:capsid protein
MKLPAFFSRVTSALRLPSSDLPVASAVAAPPLFGNSPYLYDSATNNPSRSSFVAFPLNARRELTRYNRIETLRKIRALEANFGLIRRLKSTVGKFSVGRGIFPQPQCKDEAWKQEAMEKFDDWANNRFVCDVAGAMTFWERQRFHAETFFGDGESWDALISSSVSGAPQLQLFDCSEIGNPYYSGTSFFHDGVKVNDAHRPISYEVVRQIGAGYYQPVEAFEVSANDMIHIIRRKRANQLRGISPFAPSANSAVDLMDLKSLITAAAKLHEAMGLKVTKKDGDAGKQGITGQLSKLVDSTGATQRIESFLGAGVNYMQPGEDIEIVSSNRPAQELMAFLAHLIRDVCTTAELPSEIVWDMANLGGANSRIVLADAQWFFDGVQDLLNEIFNQRVWVWWCASMMKSGQLSQCSDPRWWVCHWQGPPKLTADAGRAIQGDVLALQNGMLNWEDFHSARGANFKEKIASQIAALAWAKAECEKVDVPFEYIYALKPGTPTPSGAQSEVGGTGSSAPA